MYDILAYLYTHCEHTDVAFRTERVTKKLSAAGFEHDDIHEALHWFAGVRAGTRRSVADLPARAGSHRIFAPRELAKLDSECRGFVLELEHAGILDAPTREQVLERALAAHGDSLSLAQMKLVALMVLWDRQMPTRSLLAADLFTHLESGRAN